MLLQVVFVYGKICELLCDESLCCEVFALHEFMLSALYLADLVLWLMVQHS